MMKFLLVVLVTLEVVLLVTLTLTPANATINDTHFYTWGFANLGSREWVCKQVNITPNDRPLPPQSKMNPVSVDSLIVDEHYCSALTKPKF